MFSVENWLIPMLFPLVLMVACMSGQPGYKVQQAREQSLGRVPNAITAIRIAETVLVTLHGSARVEEWRPLRATIADSVWRIHAAVDESVLLEIGRADARLRHGLGDASAVPQLVPDSSTAAHIAEAVLLAVYSAELIDLQKPFLVEEHSGVWLVQGQLPRNMLGGVAEVEISRTDGRVLRMQHGR